MSAVCVDDEGCSRTGSALVVLALQAPDDPRPGLHAGIKQILPHQMTTAGPVLGEGRGSDAFFDALDHVIDVHGHIIGMGLSPDNRWAWRAGRDTTDGPI